MSAASPLGLVLDVSAVPPNPAGAGRYILELTRALGREGELDLFLVTRRGDTARFSTLAPGARLLELVPPSRPGRLLYERLLLARHVDSVAGGPGPVYHAPHYTCLLYTSPSPRDPKTSRMPSSA